jgi:hypothetical protein
MSRAGEVSGEVKWYYVGQQVGRGAAGFSDDMLSSCSRDRYVKSLASIQRLLANDLQADHNSILLLRRECYKY